MSIRMACPECGRLLKIKDELAGKQIKCPHCQALLRVPEAAPADAPAQPPQLAEEEPAESPEELLAQHTARRRRARVVRIAALVGLLYGLASAFGNQNPYYSWFEPSASSVEQLDRAGAWTPSPLWLPSYLLGQLLARERHAPGGYYVRSVGEWIFFYEASALLGGVFGAGVGGCVAAVMRFRERTAPAWRPPAFLAILGGVGWCVLSLFCGWVFAVIFGLLATVGARNVVEQDARALPVMLNAMLVGLVVPTLIRRMFRG